MSTCGSERRAGWFALTQDFGMIDALPLLPISTAELRRRGIGAAGIRRSVAEGTLWQIHRGWYAPAGTDAQLVRAMRLGARLGCVSALRIHGAWTPPDCGMHIAMPRSSSGRRLAAPTAFLGEEPVTVHWRSKIRDQEWTTPFSTAETALGHAIVCQPRPLAVAIADSLLHRRIVTVERLERVVRALPERHLSLLRRVDSRSEEGIESIARVLLSDAGVTAEPQVVIPGVGRVDLLIDRWLVIELDGRGTHAQSEAFNSDRRRAALLAADGRVLLRFSYAQVLYEPNFVVETVTRTLHSSRPAGR